MTIAAVNYYFPPFFLVSSQAKIFARKSLNATANFLGSCAEVIIEKPTKALWITTIALEYLNLKPPRTPLEEFVVFTGLYLSAKCLEHLRHRDE